MPNFVYFQIEGGEERWKPGPASQVHRIVEESKPMFVTALAVAKMPEELAHDEKLKLAYMGPLYFDWDSEDGDLVIEKVNEMLDKLEEMGLDLGACRLYATGGRGYHLEIPPELFMDKVPRNGVVQLPSIYREMAFKLAVDTLDVTVYSTGRGRMWRQPNVQRPNGRYKVPITVDEMRSMTNKYCEEITANPRPMEPLPKAEMSLDLAVMFAECQQRVEDLLKKRAKFKPDPKAKEKATSMSVEMLLSGIGIKEGTGFQTLATQLAIVAQTAGWSEQELVEKAEGLIHNHQSDGRRYGSPELRAEELRRMWRYMYGNVCYEFSIGALKSIMSHSAPDLDGIPTSREELAQSIKEEEAAEKDSAEQDLDEYADVAAGISLTRFGVYAQTATEGKKRVCAVSFETSSVLYSMDAGQIVGFEADILVNGRSAGRQTLELDVFSGLMQFNRFVARYGHAFNGTDPQVRTVMMRFVEQAKKKGGARYIIKREGLDLVSIPHHEDPAYRKPFLVWADNTRVIVQGDIAEKGLELAFAGYPDPRGVFKTDLSHAPALTEWIEEEGNRAKLKDVLRNAMTCQKSELLGKYLGWYVSCFWKPLFQSAYGQFPLLHVNGAAGAGKSDMTVSFSNFFYYLQEPQATSPGSTVFSLSQYVASSASIPMVLDEYKPHALDAGLVNKLRAMFRDSYNQRTVARGGGTRESDDYRALHTTQLSAPVVFIAEATESEPAVMERVVLATVVTPPPSVKSTWYARFQVFRQNRELLGIMGQYFAGMVVQSYSVERLREEFSALYAEAADRYMLNAKDLQRLEDGDEDESLSLKTNAKQRSVYNHTVAKFGFQQFRRLVNSLFDNELDSVMADLEDGLYARMSDLQASTTPEIIRVLETMSRMTYSTEDGRPDALRQGFEYGIDGDVLELDVHTAYIRYRYYMKQASLTPLFPDAHPFMSALKDLEAYKHTGTGNKLHRPGVYVLSLAALARSGVPPFKGGK